MKLRITILSDDEHDKHIEVTSPSIPDDTPFMVYIAAPGKTIIEFDHTHIPMLQAMLLPTEGTA